MFMLSESLPVISTVVQHPLDAYSARFTNHVAAPNDLFLLA